MIPANPKPAQVSIIKATIKWKKTGCRKDTSSVSYIHKRLGLWNYQLNIEICR